MVKQTLRLYLVLESTREKKSRENDFLVFGCTMESIKETRI